MPILTLFCVDIYVWLVATLKGRAASFQGAPRPPPLNETLITLFLWSQLACMLKVILYYYKQGARFAPPPHTKIGYPPSHTCMYIHSKAICGTGAFAKSWPYKGEINVMDTQLRSVGYWLCKQHAPVAPLHYCPCTLTTSCWCMWPNCWCTWEFLLSPLCVGLRGGNTMCFGGLLWYYCSVMASFRWGCLVCNLWPYNMWWCLSYQAGTSCDGTCT